MLKSFIPTQMAAHTTMEKPHHQHKIFFPLLFLLILLLFSSLLLVSSEYDLPQSYFINCGSKSDIYINNRKFIGDLNSGSSFSVGRSKAINDTNPINNTNPSTNTSLLYQTARIYRDQSSYKLEIKKADTYLVRLHFFSFLSPVNLTNALFNVSTANFSLLSNFSVQNRSTVPVIKEFFLHINEGKFKIFFIPLQKSTLAFVNAIEVFLAPFIPTNATHVTSSGSKGKYNGLLSHLLHVVHRINVGGDKLTPDNDTMLRTWRPDDEYLVDSKATNKSESSGQIKYELGGSTKFIAPDHVYLTARKTNSDSGQSNITWHFEVSKNASHLVRVHFCDIFSSSPILLFNLYIYSKFNQSIDPYSKTKLLLYPFYLDFVVDSDDSGYMNISVGPSNDSDIALLNGLEIMELIKHSSLVLMESEPKKMGQIAIAGSICAGAVVIILIVVVFLSLKCRKTKPDDTLSWPLSMPRSYHGPASSLNLALRISYAEIQTATKKFNDKLFIGKGGYGKVYLGTLRGMKVAVKRSEPGHGQGLLEFQTEIMVLSQIRHRHLVCLIGYCDEGSEMILVYEYMEKGTLREHLYNSDETSERSSTRCELTWKQRLEICIGSAKGLHYLHTGSERGIIHRDVKSTNILLDENFVAKVADFGLSKSGLVDPAYENTGVKGSFGYLDPEYLMTLQLTYKSDVYSFGVVLLEVLCARSAIITSPQTRREEVNLADWGMYWQKKGQLEKIIDPVLVGKINPNSLRIFGQIVEKCLKANGTERPDMRDVLWYLEYALQHQQAGIDPQQHDDSTTNAFMPIIQRLPSDNFPEEETDMSIGSYVGSETTASEVFSQIRIDGAR